MDWLLSFGRASVLLLTTLVVGCGGLVDLSSESGSEAAEAGRAVEPATAIDVLFMVGNWKELGDEQALLAEAVPQLLTQLLRPHCIRDDGAKLGPSELTSEGPSCAEGKVEFKPVNDIHIGVVTSSLGDHGHRGECTPGTDSYFVDANGQRILVPDDVNDKAYLMGTLGRGARALASDSTFAQTDTVRLDAQGFLAWGGTSGGAPLQSDLDSASAGFADMVAAAQTHGCGLEAQLESWFRFLVDPVPPILPILKDSNQRTHRIGSDDALLAQRAHFLRSNSLLAIVMLSDENDFSVRDEDLGWVAMDFSSSIRMGSPICATNPNDPCCYSCSESPPAGCDSCTTTGPGPDDDYQGALRGYHQKRRFGYEFLYPVSRYYVGLTHPELCPDQSFGDMDCDCTFARSISAQCDPGKRRMPNPLFSHVMGTDNAGQPVPSLDGASPVRKDSSGIILAGIVGVPWQDLSTPESQVPDVVLEYVPTTDPRWTSEHGIWERIYGDDNANIVPGDPHMIESPAPRDGIAGIDSAPWADPANSHEYDSGRFDLQYACLAPLRAAKPCACDPSSSYNDSCWYRNVTHCCSLSLNFDADGSPGGPINSPLCQNPETGQYEQVQRYDKAYPGVREVAVLHDFGLGPTNYKDRGGTGNAIVASICPKDVKTTDSTHPGYGYNPAINALAARMKEHLPKN